MNKSEEVICLEYDEKDSLIQNDDNVPTLKKYLAERIIDKKILESNEFKRIIKRIDQREEEVKSLLFDTFGDGDYDEFNALKNTDNFLKTILLKSIEKNKIVMTIQEFISKLWNLQIEKLKRPQRDICHDIIKKEDEIIKEILGNNSIVSDNKELTRDDNLNINPEKRSSLTNHVQPINDSILKKQYKNVLLIYESNHIDELKKKQINFIKEKLDSYSINYNDVSSLFNCYDWDIKIKEQFNKVDAIFLIYDEFLSKCFDDKINKDKDCKYKFIGTTMYKEYFHNGFKNERFYTFIINNCNTLNYYWLEHVHIKKNNSWEKDKGSFLIPKDSNYSNDIDKFLSSFTSN